MSVIDGYFPNRLSGIEVGILVRHVPRQPDEVLGARAALVQDRHHILQRLLHLPGQVVGDEFGLLVPGDLPGYEEELTFAEDAVGIASRWLPSWRL